MRTSPTIVTQRTRPIHCGCNRFARARTPPFGHLANGQSPFAFAQEAQVWRPAGRALSVGREAFRRIPSNEGQARNQQFDDHAPSHV
jgi:hypothetical protein